MIPDHIFLKLAVCVGSTKEHVRSMFLFASVVETLNDLYVSYFALTQMMNFLECTEQRKFLAPVKKPHLVHLRWKDTGS